MSLSKARTARTRDPEATRRKLVEAMAALVLKQGYHATTVEQVCALAGVTKGSFFHHFNGKEETGKAVLKWWGGMGMELYSAAWNAPGAEPLEQLRRMLDIMSGFTERPGQICACVVGMMSQELAQSHPELRAECARQLGIWTRHVARMLAEAKARHKPRADFDPEEAAWFLNSLWQGSMLVAKARREPEIIRRNLRMARAFVDGLFFPA